MGFDSRPVTGEHERRRGAVGFCRQGGPDAVVLNGAVDVADEGDLASLVGADHLQVQRDAVT